MDPEPDVIRQQIDQTRESLTKKVESLENQVKGTVEDVTSTVKETVEAVKETVDTVKSKVSETVEETVDTVKRTFDIPHQVQQHPFAMAGCSLLAGVALGYAVGGRRTFRGSWSYPSERGGARADLAPNYAAAPAAPERHEESRGGGLLGNLLAPFESEIGKVKEVAIGALLGMLRDALKQSLPPSLAANVEEIMNSATRKAGGEPVQGSVLAESEQGTTGQTYNNPRMSHPRGL
jgi:ElaB/YqjD/DUF883 family membrane-anchored ribosome-binding protein